MDFCLLKDLSALERSTQENDMFLKNKAPGFPTYPEHGLIQEAAGEAFLNYLGNSAGIM